LEDKSCSSETVRGVLFITAPVEPRICRRLNFSLPLVGWTIFGAGMQYCVNYLSATGGKVLRRPLTRNKKAAALSAGEKRDGF
jgi:hypothetical protein